jgi:hypothetical protein
MSIGLRSRIASVRRSRILLSACMLITSLCIIDLPNLSAQEVQDAQARIDGHLQAGEFAPALVWAQQIPDPEIRNRSLARIAEAQIRGGSRRAALDTASSMTDDRLRTSVLDTMTGYSAGSGGSRGGGTMADFDSLINLITTTLAPQTWEAIGGPGAIDSFPGGVYVDTAGLLKRLPARESAVLTQLRQMSRPTVGNQDFRRHSPLRKVSLSRLEKQIQLRWADGQAPTDEMSFLAGLEKVRYVFVYPDSGDLVLAGPAGDWTLDAEGRYVSASTGRPILQLDDFVVLLRNAVDSGGQFTCSITPRRENLAAARAYLDETTQAPLKAGQAPSWVQQLRDHLGLQDIEVAGIDPGTRVARVIVEADYRMKLVGMGLEDGVLGVTSYLDSVPLGKAQPMSVLRWWFTLNYDALQATAARDAFELRGQGVKVLSENEMLNELGERIHTGQSDDLNAQFAHDFTKHFEALAAKYPIYADLQNVFDLALVAGLIVAEDLPGQVGWHWLHFGQPNRYHVSLGTAPATVQTVANYRANRTGAVVAGVSGGVSVNTSALVSRAAIQVDDYGALEAEQVGARPRDLPPEAWWWD